MKEATIHLRPDPSPSKVGMDVTKESFELYDFTQEFREWHGIALEQAPTPWNSNSRQTEYRVPLEYSQVQGPLRPGNRNSTSSDRMKEIKTPSVVQGELVRQRDAWEMVQQLVAIDPMVLQDLLVDMWQPGQYAGYYGPQQGQYYSTIGPYASRYGYGPQTLPQIGEQIIEPSVWRSDLPKLRSTLRELEEAESKKRQRCKEAMRKFSSPHHWLSNRTLPTDIPPTTLSPTIPSTEITASEVRTSESMGTTIPKMIESSVKEITLTATTMSNNGMRQDSTNYEVQMMEFTAPLEKDQYEGAYPDFKLPIPGNSQISDLFLANTDLISDANSPVTIIQVPVLEKTFGVTIYAIDRANGQFYLVEGTKLMALNLYGFLDEQDWPDTPNIPTQAPIPSQGPQSTLTPITRVEDLQLRTEPDASQTTRNMIPMGPTSSTGIIPPLDFSNTISHDKYWEAV